MLSPRLPKAKCVYPTVAPPVPGSCRETNAFSVYLLTANDVLVTMLQHGHKYVVDC